MSIRIRLKHSSTANKAPLPADLEAGELALNTNAASPAAYLKDSAGNIVKLAGAGAVGATDATTTAKGVVQLADATAVTAGTAGRVVDAAQLKAATDADKWTRTGTTLSPKTAGDVVTVSAGTAALPGLTPVGDPDTGIWSPGADRLAVSTNGASRVEVTADGRVGVGNVLGLGLPQLLQVEKGMLVFGVGSAGGVRYVNTYADGGGYVYANAGAAAGLTMDGADGPLLFNAGDGTEKVRITADGKVGIGTSNPLGQLVVSANGAAGLEISPAAIAGGPIIRAWNRATAGSSPLTIEGQYLSLVTVDPRGSLEKVRITADGKVGIGTSSPTATLTVKGNANIATTPVYADNTAALAGGLVAGDIYRKADGTLMITF